MQRKKRCAVNASNDSFIGGYCPHSAPDTSASVVTAVWTYVGELAFNLLVLVGAIKGCDRIVKEIMGL